MSQGALTTLITSANLRPKKSSQSQGFLLPEQQLGNKIPNQFFHTFDAFIGSLPLTKYWAKTSRFRSSFRATFFSEELFPPRFSKETNFGTKCRHDPSQVPNTTTPPFRHIPR